MVSLFGATIAQDVAADELPTVKFGMIPVPVAHVFSAQANNLFKKHGVNVELVKFTSGPAQFQALESGSIQIGEGAIAAFYMARTRGLDADWVYTFGDYSPLSGVMVKPGSTVKSYKDLAGKKVTAHSGSIQHLSHIYAMMQSGLPVDGAQHVALPPPQALPALVNGDVDASWLFEPLIAQAKNKGATLLANYKDFGIRDPFGIAVNTKWLNESEENKETLVKVIAALEEGWAVFEENPEPAIAAAIEFTGTSREITEMIVKNLVWYDAADMTSANGAVSMTNPGDSSHGLANVLAWIDEVAMAGKLIDKTADHADFIYEDAVIKAAK